MGLVHVLRLPVRRWPLSAALSNSSAAAAKIVDDAGNYVEGASGYPNVIDIAFQVTFAIISTALISGALAGRVKFSAWLLFTSLWTTIVYIPLARLQWS